MKLEDVQVFFEKDGVLVTRQDNALLIHGVDPYGTTPTANDPNVIRLTVKDDLIAWHDDLDTAHDFVFQGLEALLEFFIELMGEGYKDLTLDI